MIKRPDLVKGIYVKKFLGVQFNSLLESTYYLFQFRYFSPGIYEELLRTKRQWDPENKFNHCQSIGNNDENCCPTS